MNKDLIFVMYGNNPKHMVRAKSFHIGWISASIVMVFLYIWKNIHNESVGDIFMILFAQNSAACFMNILICRRKIYI